MKTAVIFCRYIDQTQTPFDTPYYTAAYIDLLLELKRQGMHAYFATNPATYKGAGVFETAYTTDKMCTVDELTVVHNITADIVYSKGDFTATDVLLLNPPFVEYITNSKAETYRLFSEYQPQSFVCESRRELQDALQKLPGERVVVKDPFGSGGALVFIGTRQEVLGMIPDNFPLLAQEFIDTSGGIEGLVDGVHDLRIKIGGGVIWGGEIRTPAPGDLRANVGLGGSEFFLAPSAIPAEPIRIAREICKTFDGHPYYISLDFAQTANGWQLIELNNKPGLAAMAIEADDAPVVKYLAGYLKFLAIGT